MIKIDISDKKDYRIINIVKEIEKQKCTFYYDETNNNRVFWMKEDDFNSPIDENFVLGGVMHFSEKNSADVETLKRLIRLQKSAKEMKFKHIASSKDFLGCLNEKKVNIFLNWLCASDLYIHYFHVNNLYYAIIDIIDSVFDDSISIEDFYISKDDLFQVAKRNYDSFYKILYEYDYPNIEDGKIADFYGEFLKLVELNNKNEYRIKSFLLKAQNKGELPFLKNNEERVIWKNYLTCYLRPIYTFSNSYHVFDAEPEIEKHLNDIEIYDGKDKMLNYTFTNSKDNQFVQVSDCIIGIIGKYLNFINKTDVKDFEKILEDLSENQINTLVLFIKLIIKSENKCQAFFCAVQSLSEREKQGIFIHKIRQMRQKKNEKNIREVIKEKMNN